jgi:hypothetical protein
VGLGIMSLAQAPNPLIFVWNVCELKGFVGLRFVLKAEG